MRIEHYYCRLSIMVSLSIVLNKYNLDCKPPHGALDSSRVCNKCSTWVFYLILRFPSLASDLSTAIPLLHTSMFRWGAGVVMDKYLREVPVYVQFGGLVFIGRC